MKQDSRDLEGASCPERAAGESNGLVKPMDKLPCDEPGLGTLPAEPLARAEVYALLADLFYQPTEDGLDPVDTGDSLRRLAALAPRHALPAIDARHTALTAAELRDTYVAVFTHSISKDCPPYETEFGEAHVFMQTQDLADISGFYRAFGLAPSARAHERLDHLGFELEFLSFLAAKEAVHAGLDAAAICREAATTFLRDHLGRWAPAFCSRLERHAGLTVYADLARVLKTWVERDARGRGIDPADLRTIDLKPAAYDPDSSDCSSCGVGDIPDTFFNLGAKP